MVFLRWHTVWHSKGSRRADCCLFKFQSVLTVWVVTGRHKAPAHIQPHINTCTLHFLPQTHKLRPKGHLTVNPENQTPRYLTVGIVVDHTQEQYCVQLRAVTNIQTLLLLLFLFSTSSQHQDGCGDAANQLSACAKHFTCFPQI